MAMTHPLLYCTPGALPAPCPVLPPVLQRYQIVQLAHVDSTNGGLHLQNVRREPVVAAAVVAPHSGQIEMLAALRTAAPTMFLIARHPDATDNAQMRWAAFSAGANMVTHTQSDSDLLEALARVAQQQTGGHLTCDWCGLQGLTPEGYFHHQPLYHIHSANIGGTCQICGRHTSNIARHLHDHHPPPGGPPPETRTGVFALAVVRRPSDGRFLVTQEFAGAGFWIPGGGVDPGETLSQAAIRECEEEAGVHVQLKGLLHVQAARDSSWRRVILFAEPKDEMQLPKTLPDFESAGACWLGVGDNGGVRWRSDYETSWLMHVAAGGEVLPLEMPQQWAPTFADVDF